MKQIILVSGHLAALKSTISKKLSNDLNLICLNKDDLKEVLGDTIGFTNREENLKLSLATFKMMVKMMQDILKCNDIVIMESNFKFHELEELYHLASLKDIRINALFLTGKPEVLYERYVKRQSDRHPVHTSTGLMNYDVFLKSMTPFNSATYDSRVIKYDTTNMDNEIYADLFKKIQLMIQEE